MANYYYRNGYVYLTADTGKTLNPAQYLTNAPRGDQVNYGVTLTPATTTSDANGSGVYSLVSGLNLFNYGTVDGATGTDSNSHTTAASPGGDGIYLNADDTFYNGNHLGTPQTAKIYGGTGGFDPYSTAVSGPGGSLSGAGGDGADIRGGATLYNLSLSAIYAGSNGSGLGPESGIGVNLEGGTLRNEGEISSYLTDHIRTTAGAGVYVAGNGSSGNYVYNMAGGKIIGGTDAAGVEIASGAYAIASSGKAVLVNAGTITGGQDGADAYYIVSGTGGGSGVRIDAQSAVTLGSPELINTGTINAGAGNGAGLWMGSNTLAYNSGTITGHDGIQGAPGGDGAVLFSGAILDMTGGEIVGGAGSNGYGTGVLLEGATLNATGGTLSAPAGKGEAIYAIEGSSVYLGPDVTLDGDVLALDGPNTLTLTGGTGQTGTLAGYGTTVEGFGGLTFGGTDSTAASWTVDVTGGGLNGSQTFTNFMAVDTLDVQELTYDAGNMTKSFSNGNLYVSNGTDTVDFGFPGFSSASQFKVFADGSGGTDIALVTCYCRGTLIRTSRGEVRVENLAIGDRIITASGVERPLRWLGHRRIRCSGYENPASVWPICIHAGAFDEQLPRRDLWVSPGHSIAIEGHLIPACSLINGVTIEQVPADTTEYWHVELDQHDLILAEGLAAESYLDAGNRTAFANGGAFVEAFPDFEPKHWAQTCLPLILEGEVVRRAKTRLIGRVQQLGHTISSDAKVHLLADGKRLDPVHLGEQRLVFTVPDGCASLELRCRSYVPAHVDARSADSRSLGICVRRLQLNGGDVELDDRTVFGAGWYALEGEVGGSRWRWSRERAPLPSSARLVLIDVCGQRYYWDAPATPAQDTACA